MVRPPKSVEVALDLKLFSVRGTWTPNDEERRAAWELYVEMVTRVAVVPLSGGLLRESLSSLYSLFGTSRDVLRRYGPVVAEPKRGGQYSFGALVVTMLNQVVRPLLARWHPELESWENARPTGRSRAEHEQAWPRAAELRAELDATRRYLTDYAALLGTACGVPDLTQPVAVAGHEATGPRRDDPDGQITH